MTQKVLFDTDPGCDDAVALALALASDEIEVVGVSTVAGNTTVANTTHNALAILELLDRTDVPVARGCAGPLCRDLETAEEIHGPEGITGNPPEPTSEPVSQHGVEFIRDRVREYGDDLTIVAIGPQTNLATAIAIDEDLPATVDDIYLMGGAALCPGNVTPAAEFNFYVDPEAVSRVFRGATPKVVGLDVTEAATIPVATIEELVAEDEPQRTLGAWLGYSEIDAIRDGALAGDQAIHDATVIVDILDDVLDYREVPVAVGTGDGPFRGAIAPDIDGATDDLPNTQVALDVDEATHRDRIVDGIRGL
ncbi:nucleoside hydrolase [Halococcus saccharolyticus]|uniref:Inosine/uridine-preferring nucleoside hydrolase n=1 Tax=Halococcus saccharolyticus DSM 5350 TaxID=1227455 RepID=M0MNI9_9EURY|nr:nucleoside hydrolase [Halococcus saccharolyticus]EMA47226.1 inosine/uridine-preferring nucleoside hydrolase [Halococcus saccharolyticus DSM 5350]